MLYALLALAAFGLVTSSVFTGMVLWAVPGYLRERRTAFAKLENPARFTPPLSLLKPLHGAEPHLEEHLITFFEQDYPQYEILFCTRTDEDAGLAIARRVATRYPQIPARFFSTGEPPYINAKVRSMELMEEAAVHDILVISDSDVRVTPNYLRAVALPFADTRVGGITCPYRGVAAEGGVWARLEAVGMSVEMTSGVLVARMMEGMQFTLGPTMAFRRETIRRMGGFRVTADYCADDFVLGNETYKLGQTVALSHHAIDHMVINSSLVQSLKHQVRWMKSTRFSRPKGHFGTALTFSMPFGLLGLIAGIVSHHAAVGAGLLAWAIASRLALSIAVGNWVVGDRDWFNLLVLYPIRDLMGFCFWTASYFSSKILWRGRVFRLLPGGRCAPRNRLAIRYPQAVPTGGKTFLGRFHPMSAGGQEGMDNVFTSGECVPYSGVYRITHYPPHTSEEAITLAEGNTFPLCVHCSHVCFMLVNELSGSELLAYCHEL